MHHCTERFKNLSAQSVISLTNTMSACVIILLLLAGLNPLFFCSSQQPASTGDPEVIHKQYVFADIHAHPSRFHRSAVGQIEKEEVDRYLKGQIDLVVCNVSSDAAYQGGYIGPDGVQVERLRGNDSYTLESGEAYAFTLDRFMRILKTVESGDAVLALTPESVLEAKKLGKLSLLAALEGADGLEDSIENLRDLYSKGLRLLQLLHFRDNELGFNQTAPYEEGGLTDFGKEVVRECNRLGIIVDLAHSNTQTIMDALEVSEDPVIFSHTGVKALYEGDRYLTDEEIIAIADKGGMVGIWPTASLESVQGFVKHVDYVKNLVGVDHIGIASDLRGMSYIPEFGDEANFRALTEGLIAHGYTDDEVGNIMGGNFFRLWLDVSR